MSIFAFMMLIFVFSRLSGRRRWRHHRGVYVWGWRSGEHPFTQLRRGRYVRAGVEPPAPVKAPTAFESLKARYVDGSLSDAQYESELDALLKTPEGRSQMR